ncbi:hypothetical protein KVR01_009143 [Diaporthe batatas]|uniref:uncharacterized protein n=1 Tax=Diaporthe batatas TaxID=748121 RepID=UPI001D0411C5|nr:uncharacterized protein KVR01_009143 [Diaporthe batatas]KAG8160879.1 hypothetical protein KVR01_009143 [Diaporthe batatas]
MSDQRLRSTGDEERTPLLGEQQASDASASGAKPDSDPEQEGRPKLFDNLARLRVLLLLCSSVVAADFGYSLAYAPQLSISESIICNQYDHRAIQSPSGPGPSHPCKSPEVQGELALLYGWKDTFDGIPGILLALPYGVAADLIGRKPVILLALTGMILEEFLTRLILWWSAGGIVPLRSLWLAPLLQLVGGGPQIATSMVFTILTDITPMEGRASLFFRLSAAILLGEIVATPLSAILMSNWSPWIPSLLGLFCQFFALAAATAVTETLSAPTYNELSESQAHHMQDVPRPSNGSWKSKLKDAIPRCQPGGLSSNTLCAILSFLFASIGGLPLQFVIQYASKRFGWTIARASLLVTIKGIINLALLLVILPKISTILSQVMPPSRKDLRLVQASIAFLTSGTTVMAVSADPALFIIGVCLFALGWGYFAAVRSLATELVVPSKVGVLNTSFAFAQGVGGLVAGPALATALKRGVELGGFWTGLPYMIASLFLVVAAGLSYAISIPEGSHAEEDNGENHAQSQEIGT